LKEVEGGMNEVSREKNPSGKERCVLTLKKNDRRMEYAMEDHRDGGAKKGGVGECRERGVQRSP